MQVKNFPHLVFTILIPYFVTGNVTLLPKDEMEDKRMELITDIININIKTNGWNTILCLGHFSDNFYSNIQRLSLPFAVTNIDRDDHDIDDIVRYQSNFVIIDCQNWLQFEKVLRKAMSSPYWHPHSYLILYYHETENKMLIAKMFFILWYYKICNAIMVQYDDSIESLLVSYYSPYVNENFKLDNNFGCRTTRKIGMPVFEFEKGFICEDNCQKVSLYTKYRGNNLGTCIGFNTHVVLYGDFEALRKLNLFEDKGKNLHGYTLRAYATEVLPFFKINDEGNGTYTLLRRDGLLWNTISTLMNFSIDLASKNKMKQEFNFELNTQQIYSLAHRKADLYLIPVYLIDLVIVEMDNTFPYKESGVCFLAQRADFETILFDMKLLQANFMLVIQFVFCFIFSWFVFFAFNVIDKGHFSLDQVGKDLINTIRNVLSICLHKPPKRESFRIFLAISIWCYFIINFATQAAIISFFTAFKRGKEIETFEDIIEKDYPIEGMSSPDVFLPDTEERFRKLNSKLVPIMDLFGCVKNMSNNTRRFCLIDCAVGRFLERNKLNEKGEQYLHIAQDKIHSHYLNIIFPKHSTLTGKFNKYMMALVEAGIIRKWEQYRYNDIKEDAPVKALGMVDLIGIFKCYFMLLGLSTTIFVTEVAIHVFKWLKRYSTMKLIHWKTICAAKKEFILEKMFGKIKKIDCSTQTV